jgi:lactate dehydrogenase-like 2-hydroxyacid dehydrogenase
MVAQGYLHYHCCMKVVAYSVNPLEREVLAKANQKKHDITLIFNSLNLETAPFAVGKKAVLIVDNDDASAEVIERLAEKGVKYIIVRSEGTGNIDREAAKKYGIKLANTPNQLEAALQTIKNLDLWEMNKCVGKACICAGGCK